MKTFELTKVEKILFYLYRIFCMFFTLEIISNLTTLGDYENYIQGNFFYELKLYKFYENTHFMRFLIGFFKIIFFNNLFFINLFFNILSSYFIIKLINKINTKNKKIILYILMLPSFSIWSSYISKENFYIILSCICLIYLIELFYYKKLKLKDRFIFGFIFLWTLKFKIQYSLYWILLMIFYLFRNYLNKNKVRRIFMYILASLLLINFMYIFRDKIDLFFKDFDLHFQFEQAGAGKDFNIFKEKYGFFKNIIKGSLVAFYGPTFKELERNNILVIFSFIESFILIILLAYNFIRVKKYFKGVCFFILITLLISHYPFGIFNSGAAVRYRTNLIILMTVLPYLLKKISRRKNENITSD